MLIPFATVVLPCGIFTIFIFHYERRRCSGGTTMPGRGFLQMFWPGSSGPGPVSVSWTGILAGWRRMLIRKRAVKVEAGDCA